MSRAVTAPRRPPATRLPAAVAAVTLAFPTAAAAATHGHGGSSLLFAPALLGIGIPSISDILRSIANDLFNVLAGAFLPGWLKHAPAATLRWLIALARPGRRRPVAHDAPARAGHHGRRRRVPAPDARRRGRPLHRLRRRRRRAPPRRVAGRLVGAAFGLVIFPWAFSNMVAAVNVTTTALLSFADIDHGLQRALALMFTGGLLFGVTGPLIAVLVIGAILLAAGLFVMKVGILALFAILFVAGPLTLACYPIPELHGAFRLWSGLLIALAAIPIGWCVIFATAGAISGGHHPHRHPRRDRHPTRRVLRRRPHLLDRVPLALLPHHHGPQPRIAVHRPRWRRERAERRRAAPRSVNGRRRPGPRCSPRVAPSAPPSPRRAPPRECRAEASPAPARGWPRAAPAAAAGTGPHGPVPGRNGRRLGWPARPGGRQPPRAHAAGQSGRGGRVDARPPRRRRCGRASRTAARRTAAAKPARQSSRRRQHERAQAGTPPAQRQRPAAAAHPRPRRGSPAPIRHAGRGRPPRKRRPRRAVAPRPRARQWTPPPPLAPPPPRRPPLRTPQSPSRPRRRRRERHVALRRRPARQRHRREKPNRRPARPRSRPPIRRRRLAQRPSRPPTRRRRHLPVRATNPEDGCPDGASHVQAVGRAAQARWVLVHPMARSDRPRGARVRARAAARPADPARDQPLHPARRRPRRADVLLRVGPARACCASRATAPAGFAAPASITPARGPKRRSRSAEPSRTPHGRRGPRRSRR